MSFLTSKSINDPPLTQLFLTHLWYGPYAENVGGKREAEVHKCVEIGCQFIVQNTHTDRQVKHKPKEDTGFVRHVETPLSVGLPLTIHQRVRDKSLVQVLSSVYLGSGYEHVLNITKRLEHAVLLRMTDTGGYCLPNFIKKGVTIFFAVDNIDFTEDTPYGQGTLHGSLIVVYQKEDENAEPINPPLAIPDKAPSTPLHVDIKYKNEPVINLKPMKFTSYTIGQRAALLKPYRRYDETWALANHMANDIDNCARPSSDISTDIITTTISDHGIDQSSDNVIMTPIPLQTLSSSSEDVVTSIHGPNIISQSDSPEHANNTSNKAIIHVTQHPRKKEKKTKADVMPTWAATQSLLQSGQHVTRTNSEVLAPLFKTSPTDYATLWSVLSLTQEISAVVVGPERRTIITLDLDLYERALKIQQSVNTDRWVLRAGELHICFAALHALGKYLEGSGLDTVAIETGIYSPAALRGIYTGKAFKRGVEYHLMNALACFFLLFDAVLGNMSPDTPLQKQCMELKTNLHHRSVENVTDIYDDLASHYADQIEGKVTGMDAGGLAQFLTNYMKQVQCLLHIISTCRQGDWEGYLAALDDQIHYFFAHDLYHYARLMPVHLAQMNQLEQDDPTIWKALKDGNFCVKNRTHPSLLCLQIRPLSRRSRS